MKLGSSTCPGVYNDRCDGGKSYLCRDSPRMVSYSASCLYQPANALSTAFQPTTASQLTSAVRTYLVSHPSGKCDDDRSTEKIKDRVVPTTTIAQPSETTRGGMEVSIQYSEGFGAKSNWLKSQLEETFGSQISVKEIQNEGGIKGDSEGDFEVVVNGDLIWSKANIGYHDFPMNKGNVEMISDAIRYRFDRLAHSTPGGIKISIQYCGA